MDKIIIIGGGGLAKVVISILRKVNKYEICGYTETVDRGSVLQVPYLGDDVFLEKLSQDLIVIDFEKEIIPLDINPEDFSKQKKGK